MAEVGEAMTTLAIFTQIFAECPMATTVQHAATAASAALEAIVLHSDERLAALCLSVFRSVAGLGQSDMDDQQRSQWARVLEGSVGSTIAALKEASWLQNPTAHLSTMLMTALMALPDEHMGLGAAYAQAAQALAAAAAGLPPHHAARVFVFVAARSIGQAALSLALESPRRRHCGAFLRVVAPAAVACLCEPQNSPDPKVDPKVEAFKVILVAHSVAEESCKETILEVFVPLLAKLTAEDTPAHLTKLATSTITSMAALPAFKAQLALLPDNMKMDLGNALRAAATTNQPKAGAKASAKPVKKLTLGAFK